MEALALVEPMLALLQATGDVTMIGVGIAAGTAVIGPGVGMGYLIGQTIASIHRQPEAFEQTRTKYAMPITCWRLAETATTSARPLTATCASWIGWSSGPKVRRGLAALA